LCVSAFFFSHYRAHRDLHSFPTRRSSDLTSSTFREATRGSPNPRDSDPSGRTRCTLTPCVTHWIFGMSLFSRETKRARWSKTTRSEEHTSELQSRGHLVCRLLLEKKKKNT